MSVIEPAGNDSCDEELGSIGVLSGIGHGEESRLVVLELKVLIWKTLAIDGLAASAVTLGEITALEHEVGDHTVERRSLVAKAVLASSEFTEVFASLGDDVIEELENDAPSRLVVDRDIKEYVGHDGNVNR